MEDNTGRVSSDSWIGRRRKRSRVEMEEQERQEGEQRGGDLERRSGGSRMSLCMQQLGLLNNVVIVLTTPGGLLMYLNYTH